MKTNNCPCSYGEAQEDVDTTDLQVIYDANVITAVHKADVRLLFDNCKLYISLTTSAFNVCLSSVVLAITNSIFMHFCVTQKFD